MKNNKMVDKAIERIKLNEERFEEVSIVIENLEKSINDYKKSCQKIIEINKYYGSKNWFNDKDNLENGIIKNIKVGVLSEDEIWNLLYKINELNEEMNEITSKISRSDEDEFK